jgi:hypothetical protein
VMNSKRSIISGRSIVIVTRRLLKHQKSIP